MTHPTPITLSVDCMGGDHGPRVTLAACRRFLQNHPDAHLLLVGRAEALSGFDDPRVEVVATTEVVEMDDPLEVALRKKKDSSMRVAIEQVKTGQAQAAVSAGNTGAHGIQSRAARPVYPRQTKHMKRETVIYEKRMPFLFGAHAARPAFGIGANF